MRDNEMRNYLLCIHGTVSLAPLAKICQQYRRNRIKRIAAPSGACLSSVRPIPIPVAECQPLLRVFRAGLVVEEQSVPGSSREFAAERTNARRDPSQFLKK